MAGSKLRLGDKFGIPSKFSAFNSRDDKLTRNWTVPFTHRRALLPATWYDEKGTAFHLPSDELFALAAIYTIAPAPDGRDLVTYSMVTREAVGDAARVNDRMLLSMGRRVHDLRHTAVTLWLTAGVDPKTVQHWLGHTSMTLTVDLYSHWMGTDADAAGVARVNSTLGPNTSDYEIVHPGPSQGHTGIGLG